MPLALAITPLFWHGRAMASKNTVSGGVFFPIGIFAGLAIGAFAGQAMTGVLLGTAGGAAAAAYVWIMDSAKRKRADRSDD